MNKTEQERITAHIREDHPYVVALRRYFHQHPEIAKEEFHTAERIEAELDKIGLAHKRVGETGVYAEIQGERPGKTIVLRADIKKSVAAKPKGLVYLEVKANCTHNLYP